MSPEYVVINSRRYKVHTGERGGHYVNIQGKKQYLKHRKSQKGGTTHEHMIQVFENIEDDEKMRETSHRLHIPHMYYHETKSDIASNPNAEDVKNLLSTMFPSEDNMHTHADEVLNELYRLAEYGYSKTITYKTIPRDAKLIVIGDVHGEIDPIKNTFVHWYEQGYLLPSGHLAPDVYIVSTGDLVDYSINSFDVIYAMLKLRSLNHNQVILLRGNHEGEWWVSGKQTLYSELNARKILPHIKNSFQGRSIPSVPQSAKWTMEANMKHVYYPEFQRLNPNSTKEEIEPVLNEFIKKLPYVHYFLYFSALLRGIGSCMLLLNFQDDNDRFAFMHGMWPVVNYSQSDVILENEKDIWYQDDEDPQTPMRTYDNCRANYETAIMWNDLSDGTETKKGSRGIPYCVQIGSADLHTIMEKNKVKAIIRGHQDLCHTQQGMMTYGENGNLTCMNGVATTLMKECANGSVPTAGWCVSPTIYVQGTPNDEEDAIRRIITSSMAHRKSGGFACMGAYTLISKREHQHIPTQEGGNGSKNIHIPTAVYPPFIRGELTPFPSENCRRKDKKNIEEVGGKKTSKTSKK